MLPKVVSDKVGFFKFKISNKVKQKIYKQILLMDFKNLMKKIGEPKVLRHLLNFCDFQLKIFRLGYGLKSL